MFVNMDSVMALVLSIHFWKCEQISSLGFFFLLFLSYLYPKDDSHFISNVNVFQVFRAVVTVIILHDIMLIQLSFHHSHWYLQMCILAAVTPACVTFRGKWRMTQIEMHCQFA